MEACVDAIALAEADYSKWTGGYTMRSAPESFVQTYVAQALARAGATVHLEASVKLILQVASGLDDIEVPRSEGGRIDIAVFYKSKAKKKTPRFILEVKKLSTHHSLDEDHARVLEVLERCPNMQNGILVGYTTAVNADTAEGRLKAVTEHLGCKRIKSYGPHPVKGRNGDSRFLSAGIFRVDRSAQRADY
jgi:hypothetical protein